MDSLTWDFWCYGGIVSIAWRDFVRKRMEDGGRSRTTDFVFGEGLFVDICGLLRIDLPNPTL